MAARAPGRPGRPTASASSLSDSSRRRAGCCAPSATATPRARWSPGSCAFSFFFTATSTTEIYTLSLHDALPILDRIISYAQEHHLENLIAIDNTASVDFVKNYIKLAENGFDLVSSNKIGNTIGLDFYDKLRKVLAENQKNYLYETNVGAGLPLIDTIKLLHLSGENITRIRGVFSGSLSYLFNHFSVEDRPFSIILKEAIDRGYTEPDAREDLCGNDVARKLLILARELDLRNELTDVQIQNLIPENLREVSSEEFLNRIEELDELYNEVKQDQNPNHVLR